MLSNGNSTPRVFVQLNTKKGKFVVNRGKDKPKEEYSQLRDVRLIKIEGKDDEYEGIPFRKVVMQMQSDDLYQVEANMGTFCAAKMIACLAKADLSEVVGLSIRIQAAGSTYTRADKSVSEPLQSDITSVSVWQGESFIQLATEDMPPKTVKQMVGRKEVIDSSDREDFVEAKIKEIAAKLGQQNPAPRPAPSATTGTPGLPKAPPGGNPGDFEDDIPF